MEQLGSHWTNFHEIWYLWIFRKLSRKIQVSLKSDHNNGNFIWRPINIFNISYTFLLRIRNVSEKICKENQNTHFGSVTFFRKSCRLWDNVEIYCRAEQAMDDNMAHAHCLLDTLGYKHTHCFSTTKIVSRTRLSDTFYVYFLFLSSFIFLC